MIYKGPSKKQIKKIANRPSATFRYHAVLDQAPQQNKILANRTIACAIDRCIPLQMDEKLISQLIDTDLGESIPPQLYSLMAEVFSILKEVEKNT